jgi:hypothetical protein
MYKCPICKHSRTHKLHTDKCSKLARETLEPTTPEPKTDWSALPTNDNVKFRKTLSRF